MRGATEEWSKLHRPFSTLARRGQNRLRTYTARAWTAIWRAHDNLDRAVTAAYGKRRPRTDADRLTVLFERYAILTGSTRLLEDEMLAPGAIFVPGQRDPQ